MVHLSSTTPIRSQEIPAGKHPVTFGYTDCVHVDHYLPELELICRQLWTYLGHAGLGPLWADDSRNKIILAKNPDKLKRFFWHMDSLDIDWRSYCYLVLPLVPYTSWERLLLLVNNARHWHWMYKLRQHVETSEDLDELADFVLEFMRLQIAHVGSARVSTSSSIQQEPGPRKGKSWRNQYYAVYTQLATRLRQFKSQGIDSGLWLDTKFKRCMALDYVYLATVVNANGFDPDVSELRAIENDEWRAIRSHLGLARDCEFPDGQIPVGWQPPVEDPNNVWDIQSVTKDGFYFYANGEQRRGRFAYMKNRYHAIGCTPANFAQFVADWHDARRLTARPTWAEYSQYAVYPGMWNDKGESTNGRIPNVRWRVG